MTTVGQEWKKNIESRNRRLGELSEQDQQERADYIIQKIPSKIERAIKKGTLVIKVSEGRLTSEDTKIKSLEQLAHKVQQANTHLSEDDLAGYLKLVVIWCQRNDLVCSLQRKKVRRDTNEYILIASPK